MSMFTIIVLVLFGLLMIFSIYKIVEEKINDRKDEQARAIKWQNLAQKMKFEYYKDVSQESNKLDFPEDLELNSGPYRAFNILYREIEGFKVRVFDTKYRTGSGENTTWHIQTKFFAEKDGITLPKFSMTPKKNAPGKLDMLFSDFANEEVSFENDLPFSNAFVILGNEWHLTKLFNTKVRGFLLNRKERYRFVSSQNNGVLVIAEKNLEPDDFQELASFSIEFLAVLDHAVRSNI